MSEPRNLFQPESPLANLAPGAQAAAAAGLLSSHLNDLRKIHHVLNLPATIAELESQLSSLEDAELLAGYGGVSLAGVNVALARTRMQNCLKMARAMQACLTATENIALGIMKAEPADPPPIDDKKARRRQYLLECGREDLAREEGLL